AAPLYSSRHAPPPSPPSFPTPRSSDLDPVDAGHRQIHEHDVGPVRDGEVDGLAAVACSAHELEVVGGPHELLETVSHDGMVIGRSEEHTSELQSQSNLVCRLLLEIKHY